MGEDPPAKKSKGFTAKKKKAYRPILPKVELPPKLEETTMIPIVEEVGLTPSTTSKQPDSVILLEDIEGAKEQIPRSDAAKDDSAFFEPVGGW